MHSELFYLQIVKFNLKLVLDEKSYKDLFKIYFVPLCYFARKHNLDHFDSEEVVQRVFLNLWEKRDRLVVEQSVSAYLYQSVKNESLNFLKKKSLTVKNKEEYTIKIKNAELFSLITEEDGASAILANELEQKINQSINNLPDKCKEIFLLSRREYLSIKEIAEKLNLSVNTVQRQISIAISKLKEMLKSYISVIFVILCNFL